MNYPFPYLLLQTKPETCFETRVQRDTRGPAIWLGWDLGPRDQRSRSLVNIWIPEQLSCRHAVV